MLALEWNLDDALQARFEDGMELGMKQGRNEERENFAVKLIRRGSPFDEIHELYGFAFATHSRTRQRQS